VARYGKDKTFSVPILTHCALAGLVDWREIPALPFELACLPPRFYKTVRLPVVSYALPALIAIGQVRHHFRKPRNPLTRLLRRFAIEPSLKVLDHIQPTNGGFLEAAPLTSFVTMSLAAMGRADHPVARRGTQFLIDSVLADGSWPIDTNLATWVTTLSVNALNDDLPESAHAPIREWLLGQQYQDVHPYTQADPGGWAWSDLPGAVPDADDTPGAILALLKLTRTTDDPAVRERVARATHNGMRWLLDLQNRDGGWPTFCRGWGALPFDRSGADLTAHAIRAGLAWSGSDVCAASDPLLRRLRPVIERGFRYLDLQQRADGSWLPLWFGNQHCHDDENGVYGTARVLAAYRDAGRLEAPAARRGLQFLTEAQHADGGWGGMPGAPPSIEETALATEIMLSADPHSEQSCAALAWLLERIEAEDYTDPSPIGFYFAKLWYFEATYPLSFIVGALRRAVEPVSAESGGGFTAQEQTARVRLRAE
jgi:squalene-hopene/tetraprenyl-beta-curcumene cyclase